MTQQKGRVTTAPIQFPGEEDCRYWTVFYGGDLDLSETWGDVRKACADFATDIMVAAEKLSRDEAIAAD